MVQASVYKDGYIDMYFPQSGYVTNIPTSKTGADIVVDPDGKLTVSSYNGILIRVTLIINISTDGGQTLTNLDDINFLTVLPVAVPIGATPSFVTDYCKLYENEKLSVLFINDQSGDKRKLRIIDKATGGVVDPTYTGVQLTAFTAKTIYNNLIA